MGPILYLHDLIPAHLHQFPKTHGAQFKHSALVIDDHFYNTRRIVADSQLSHEP